MAKIDKSNLTKEEFRKLREEKRLRKQQRIIEKTYEENLKNYSDGLPKNVICLKHGQKYNADYVNKLYNMVSRNITVPFKMHCITEDRDGINPNVNIIPLPKIPQDQNVNGWWYKPYIYSKDLPVEGTILYMDLDVVITANIDKLFTYNPGKFCVIRDFTRVMRPNWPKFNSSIMRFEKGQLDMVYTKFEKNAQNIMKRFFGDQDYLFDEMQNNATLWPDNWIMSWKWEIRKSKQFAPNGRRGERKLAVKEDVYPPESCCIAVFHGDPNPHNCEDPFIVDNWHKI